MKKKTKLITHEMRAEYNFSGGVRGKYAKRFKRGTNLVMLAPDVAKVFHNERDVNEALRAVIKIAKSEFAHAR